MTAGEALARLREGNGRFVARLRAQGAGSPPRLVAEHRPIAIVLGCSDARVPPEIVFDQGIGDLFVVRVAGHVVDPVVVGSIELAAERFGPRLVVVLGHERCGAVLATVEAIRRPGSAPGAAQESIVAALRPRVEPWAEAAASGSDEALSGAVRANVRGAVARLLEASERLRALAREDGLSVVGAEYALATGVVTFLDEGTAPTRA